MTKVFSGTLYLSIPFELLFLHFLTGKNVDVKCLINKKLDEHYDQTFGRAKEKPLFTDVYGAVMKSIDNLSIKDIQISGKNCLLSIKWSGKFYVT